jgi:chromate transporter
LTDSTGVEQPPSVVSRAEAFRFWLKLGFISFGGPAGQTAVMHQELVEQPRWISKRRFLHALNYCMVLPGPEAQQLATYIGWLMHRTWGGLIAGGLFVLPSLVLLVLLSWIYVVYGQVPVVAAVFSGIKPAVVAIICFAAYRIGGRVVHTVALGAIAGIAFLAIFLFNVPFPWIVLAAGVIAYFGGRTIQICSMTDPHTAIRINPMGEHSSTTTRRHRRMHDRHGVMG